MYVCVYVCRPTGAVGRLYVCSRSSIATWARAGCTRHVLRPPLPAAPTAPLEQAARVARTPPGLWPPPAPPPAQTAGTGGAASRRATRVWLPAGCSNPRSGHRGRALPLAQGSPGTADGVTGGNNRRGCRGMSHARRGCRGTSHARSAWCAARCTVRRCHGRAQQRLGCSALSRPLCAAPLSRVSHLASAIDGAQRLHGGCLVD